jgi:hypothetical protein
MSGIGVPDDELEGEETPMELNLPILDRLMACKHLLIAGMGGGFDLFCGLPIYFELQRRGQKAHLANYSFAPAALLRRKEGLTDTLVEVTADVKGPAVAFPELSLTRWFRERRGEETPIWCFAKTGPRGLRADYRALVDHLQVDGILLVDGGVDSLLQGDETEVGTLVEDATSMVAVEALRDVPLRLVACIGFGAERDMTHAQVLENIAALAAADGFLGACSLVRQMEAYQAYEEAVTAVHGQPFQDPSVINASILSAVRGHYGDYHLTQKTKGSRLWISPLMPVYWFFDFAAVVQRNRFLAEIVETDSFMEAATAFLQWRQRARVRPASRIPLP